jgi:hypothetical protein
MAPHFRSEGEARGEFIQITHSLRVFFRSKELVLISQMSTSSKNLTHLTSVAYKA